MAPKSKSAAAKPKAKVEPKAKAKAEPKAKAAPLPYNFLQGLDQESLAVLFLNMLHHEVSNADSEVEQVAMILRAVYQHTALPEVQRDVESIPLRPDLAVALATEGICAVVPILIRIVLFHANTRRPLMPGTTQRQRTLAIFRSVLGFKERYMNVDITRLNLEEIKLAVVQLMENNTFNAAPAMNPPQLTPPGSPQREGEEQLQDFMDALKTALTDEDDDLLKKFATMYVMVFTTYDVSRILNNPDFADIFNVAMARTHYAAMHSSIQTSVSSAVSTFGEKLAEAPWEPGMTENQKNKKILGALLVFMETFKQHFLNAFDIDTSSHDEEHIAQNIMRLSEELARQLLQEQLPGLEITDEMAQAVRFVTPAQLGLPPTTGAAVPKAKAAPGGFRPFMGRGRRIEEPEEEEPPAAELEAEMDLDRTKDFLGMLRGTFHREDFDVLDQMTGLILNVLSVVNVQAMVDGISDEAKADLAEVFQDVRDSIKERMLHVHRFLERTLSMDFNADVNVPERDFYNNIFGFVVLAINYFVNFYVDRNALGLALGPNVGADARRANVQAVRRSLARQLFVEQFPEAPVPGDDVLDHIRGPM